MYPILVALFLDFSHTALKKMLVGSIQPDRTDLHQGEYPDSCVVVLQHCDVKMPGIETFDFIPRT